MGCTSGKTSNPNKNQQNDKVNIILIQVKAQPLNQANQNPPLNNAQNLNSNTMAPNVGQNYQTNELGYQGSNINNNGSHINQPSQINNAVSNQGMNQSGIKGSSISSPKNNENMMISQQNNLGNSNLGYNSNYKNSNQ